MRHQNACASACLLLLLCLHFKALNAQPAADPTPPGTGNYLKTIDGKMSAYDDKVVTYSQHALDAMLDAERRMQARVSKTDPAYSSRMFGYAIDSLQRLRSALTTATAMSGRLSRLNYFPYTDSLRQALAFLQKTSGVAGQASALSSQLASSVERLNVLEGKLNTIATIQNFVQQRMEVLNSVAAKFPDCRGAVQRLQQTAYYYSAQMAQYKGLLQNPAAIERQILDRIGPTATFQSLMQNKGQLAGLFAPRSAFSVASLSGGGVPGLAQVGAGSSALPNRATVQEYIRKNNPAIGDTTDVAGTLQSKFAAAGDKLHESGASLPAIPSMPSFTPNNQKTMPFGKRIEWGFDVQFGKAVSYLPATANIGIKAGYRLSDRLSAGLGVDYLMGIGTGWKDIHLSNQGVGLRQYGKWLIKKGWNLQEGVELNYLSAFKNISQLRGLPNWQTSALLGISKQYRVSRKLTGNFQVLYDFLYHQHQPTTQPVLFRLGYDLN